MSQAEEHLMSALATELARILAGFRTKRVQIDVVFNGANRFDPALIGHPKSRARIRAALDELVSADKIAFPAVGSRTGWDMRAHPPLPNWVTRVVAPVVSPLPEPGGRVWPKALETAGQLATRPDERKLLERVSAWMRDTPDPIAVPVQERSLELFDDEKALDRYMKTRLFTVGGLSLSTLACFIPSQPFVSQYVPGKGEAQLLVLENLASYHSFLAALRALKPADRPSLHVGWGHGTSFAQSILSMTMLHPAPVGASYFGDLDLAGLQTAARAAEQAAAAGLPRLRPVEDHYRFLLNGPGKWRKPDASNRHTSSDYPAACRWLPVSLRDQALSLLHARQRIPQERLGLSALLAHPQLWTEFGPSVSPN